MSLLRSFFPLLLLTVAAAAMLDSPRPAMAATRDSEELENVLKELRQVELEIERYLVDEASGTSPQTVQDVEPLVPLLDEPAQQDAAPELAAPPSTPGSLLPGVSDDIQALARAKVEGRSQLTDAEAGVRLSTALLVGEVNRTGSDPVALLTLSLIQTRHLASAEAAVEQLLELEQVRLGRTRAAARVASVPKPRKKPAENGGGRTKLDELRSRHRELSKRLSELSERVDSARIKYVGLEDQRAVLNQLLVRLSGVRGESPASSPPGSPSLSTEAGPEHAATAREENEEGRRVFWRAKRSRIHALASGKVLFAGAFGGYRHLLILDHGDGWTSLYGNMTDCYVKADQALSGGSSLGEYQAEAIGDPEPFWVEVRKDRGPVPVETLPDIPKNWSDFLFADSKR